jgi:hypothetical protein
MYPALPGEGSIGALTANFVAGFVVMAMIRSGVCLLEQIWPGLVAASDNRAMVTHRNPICHSNRQPPSELQQDEAAPLVDIATAGTVADPGLHVKLCLTNRR